MCSNNKHAKRAKFLLQQSNIVSLLLLMFVLLSSNPYFCLLYIKVRCWVFPKKKKDISYSISHL